MTKATRKIHDVSTRRCNQKSEKVRVHAHNRTNGQLGSDREKAFYSPTQAWHLSVHLLAELATHCPWAFSYDVSP